MEKNDARGVGIFLFSAAGEEMRKSARQRHARNVSKRKILQGGVGGSVGPGPVVSEMDRVGTRIAAWFYCARLRGIRLQNGLGKIASGMSELEKSLARGA